MTKQAIILTGLAFGDEGKGTMTDYYTREYNSKWNIRFNGGAQAAHRVETPEGVSHVFRQFGSGTLAGANTFYSEKCVFDPLALMREVTQLKELLNDPLKKFFIDPQCLVATPWHKAVNRIKECARAKSDPKGRHGSCGMGVGEVIADSNSGDEIRVCDLQHERNLRAKIKRYQQRKLTEFEPLLQYADEKTEAMIREEVDEYLNFMDVFNKYLQVDTLENLGILDCETVILEGAQGVLLDQVYGFFPYVTRSNTSTINAINILNQNLYNGSVKRIGVTRAYSTRHGPGPFPTNNFEFAQNLPDVENCMNDWQRDFRVGPLDLVMLKYALRVNPVNQIDITCLDRFKDGKIKICTEYSNGDILFTPNPTTMWMGMITQGLMKCKPVYHEVHIEDIPEFVSNFLGIKVGICSHGPTREDKYENENCSSK